VAAKGKLAGKRLAVLKLAEALGEVPEVYRRRGISRTQFCEYKRRFQTHGRVSLKASGEGQESSSLKRNGYPSYSL